ncbi:hypothetical protein [Streptomyces sp. NPDC094468]|uniref:hypothetical protein n=1 Tax=Streptomyces sp. NPDC094468 TaxID=3366066 RepID=UPI003806BA28
MTSHEAWRQTQSLLRVVVFLVLILVLDRLCADEDLFEAAGSTVERRCGSGGAAR